ncbi:MAG: hydrolase / 5-amino-6-(5-phospho-D-ribitylamino)uracil phosphatase [Pseudonocardiales bacterium]|jgi:putative hydrolase of the HAD superfamily|nr:hydrolase / 5-amino-6-(5-phospho-D-ribitylamino)uracil phosphatase [Pseudonocardiales bacterium]
MIDAVIFDWGGTLAPWVTIDHLAGWRAYADVVHPGDATAAERAATALLAAENGRWRRVREEHRAFTLAQVVADATEALGGPVLPYREDALTAFREFWTVATHTHAEVAPTLSRLRERGLALGVLSSTGWPGAWHEEFLRRDGVLELFDACVWTSDLDWTKPHPEAFRAAMAAVGATDPARCVYVGDRPYDDIAGAKGIGMRAVFVPHSVIPLDQQVPVDVEPDAVIQRLSELPELLATW